MAFYLDLARRAAPFVEPLLDAAWLDRLKPDRHNLRTAIEHAISTRNADAALELVGSVGNLWMVYGPDTEGLHLVDRALALGAGAKPELLVEPLRLAGVSRRRRRRPRPAAGHCSATSGAWTRPRSPARRRSRPGWIRAARGAQRRSRQRRRMARPHAIDRRSPRPPSLLLARRGEPHRHPAPAWATERGCAPQRRVALERGGDAELLAGDDGPHNAGWAALELGEHATATRRVWEALDRALEGRCARPGPDHGDAAAGLRARAARSRTAAVALGDATGSATSSGYRCSASSVSVSGLVATRRSVMRPRRSHRAGSAPETIVGAPRPC